MGSLYNEGCNSAGRQISSSDQKVSKIVCSGVQHSSQTFEYLGPRSLVSSFQLFRSNVLASFPGTRKIGGSTWYTRFAHARKISCKIYRDM